MSFFSIVCVLVLEQFKAVPAAWIQARLKACAGFLEHHFNGGEPQQGITAWLVGVAFPVFLLVLLQWAAASVHPLMSFLLAVAVLYLAVGFRQFSHFFTDIHLALRTGDTEQARRLLASWRGKNADRLAPGEIARLAIETGIVAAHRHVFGPLFWFILAGPAGALCYRLAACFSHFWQTHPTVTAHPVPIATPFLSSGIEGKGFGWFAQRAFAWIDWLPARFTATTFAVVGDFEDAVYCWRTQAAQWTEVGDEASGILLASGAGALGIRLGLSLPDAGEASGVGHHRSRPELGLGDETAIEHLQSATGLVWRALVLCLLLLALLTLASWTGA